MNNEEFPVQATQGANSDSPKPLTVKEIFKILLRIFLLAIALGIMCIVSLMAIFYSWRYLNTTLIREIDTPLFHIEVYSQDAISAGTFDSQTIYAEPKTGPITERRLIYETEYLFYDSLDIHIIDSQTIEINFIFEGIYNERFYCYYDFGEPDEHCFYYRSGRSRLYNFPDVR